MKILAITLAGMSVLFLFLSMFNKVREHSHKVAGFLALLSLSLFADNLSTYLLAIAIIGTVVASERFIERIVAIYQKYDKYFEKEPMSQEEQIEKAKKEIETIDKIEQKLTSEQIQLLPSKSRITEYLITENYVLSYIQKLYNVPVQPHMKFIDKRNQRRFEFDGFIDLPEKDIIIEVKLIRNTGQIGSRYNAAVEQLLTYANAYQSVKSKPFELLLVFVTPELSNEDKFLFNDKLNRFIQEKTKNMAVIASVKVLTYKDIEFKE